MTNLIYKLGNILKHIDNTASDRRILELVYNEPEFDEDEGEWIDGRWSYLWEYADLPSSENNLFNSDDSCDPDMTLEWELKQR